MSGSERACGEGDAPSVPSSWHLLVPFCGVPELGSGGARSPASAATSSSKSRNMASRSAGRPVISSKVSAAWCTAMPAPFRRPAAAGGGGHAAARCTAGGRRCRRPTGPGAAASRATGRAGVRGHADRGGVDQARGAARARPARPRRRASRTPRRADRSGSSDRPAPGPGLVGVDDQEPSRPEADQRVRDRGARAARAEQHDLVEVERRAARRGTRGRTR